MSQENVEVVRGIYDAVARRDAVTPFEVYAEDIVWDVSKTSLTERGFTPCSSWKGFASCFVPPCGPAVSAVR